MKKLLLLLLASGITFLYGQSGGYYSSTYSGGNNYQETGYGNGVSYSGGVSSSSTYSGGVSVSGGVSYGGGATFGGGNHHDHTCNSSCSGGYRVNTTRRVNRFENGHNWNVTSGQVWIPGFYSYNRGCRTWNAGAYEWRVMHRNRVTSTGHGNGHGHVQGHGQSHGYGNGHGQHRRSYKQVYSHRGNGRSGYGHNRGRSHYGR